MKKIFILLSLFSNFLGFNDKYRNSQKECIAFEHFEDPVEKLSIIHKKYSINNIKNEGDIYDTGLSKPHFGETYYEGGAEVENFQNHNFSLKEYFENMGDFMPYNSVGSCGFVAIAEVMSYYDTFYNDDIVPEKYEVKVNNAKNKSNLHYKSPGTKRIKYSESEDGNFKDFCEKNKNSDLQSKLILDFNSRYPSWTFSGSCGQEHYNGILNKFFSSNIAYSHRYTGFSTQQEYINIAKEIIDSGNPAILSITKVVNGETIGHAVVAYDYDKNGIYANFGYGRGYTKRLVYSDGYDTIRSISTLDFSSFGHKHSNNYVIDGFSYCGCNMPGEVSFKVAPNWINVPPRLYWMKQPGQNNMYTVEFKKWKNGDSLLSKNTMGNALTLSFIQWKRIIEECNDKIYISVTVTNNENVLAITETEIDKPTQYLDYFVVAPNQYGFYDGYPTDNGTRDNYSYIPTLENGYAFRTKRFRTGYIHKEYVVLSCIRDNYSYASLEYAFSSPVTKIEVDLSFWRDKTYELFTKDNDKVEFQIWRDYENPSIGNEGEWIKKFDLLSSETNMPEDRNYQTTHTIEFDTPVYGFRFFSSVDKR